MDNLGYCCSHGAEDDKPFEYYESSSTLPVSSSISSEKPNGIPKIIESQTLARVEEGGGDGGQSSISPGRCGIFCWKPQWMQRFPTRNWFIVVFLLAATIKGMSGSYFPATISSVEKRLKLSTETIGVVSSGSEVSQILLALILSYVGGKGHRPRWIAFGVFCSAVAYLLYAMPHFIYGPGNEALSLTAEYYSHFHNSTYPSALHENTTELENDVNAVSICKATPSYTSSINIDCGLGDNSIIPMGLIFLAQFVAGVGSVLFYTLAGPYIDDHMQPVRAPIIIAVTGAVRQSGPLIGYVVAYFCLKLFVNPLLTPLITNKDDRWLGAWWLGWVFYAILMAMASALMVLFPRILETSTKSKGSEPEIDVDMKASNGATVVVQECEEPPKLEPIYQPCEKDHLNFCASIKDLMLNKINLWNNLSILCFGFAFSGFSTYYPKYVENVLKQNAADAAITTGGSSILFQVAGLLASGFIISKFKLRARTLAGVNVLVDLMIIIVVFSFSQLVCKQGQVVDTSVLTNYNNIVSQDFDANLSWQNSSSSLNFSLSSTGREEACSANCNCESSQITPVCYEEKRLVYYSACHAGCTSYNASSKVFTNCSCLPSPDITLTLGKCVDPDACHSAFVIFIALTALIRFATSFGRIGNVLIPYRCVDRSQKSLASGLSFVMWSIVSIPSPIMYGKIIDSTCILWGTKCGERGSCLLYNDVDYAYAMSTTAAGLASLGLVCDAMMWYYVKDLKLYGERNDETEKEKETKN